MQTGQPGDRACGDHQQNGRADLMHLRARPCIETRALHFHCTSCASAEQARIAPVRDRIARRGAGLAGTAGQAFERGSPRRRWPPRYAPNSSTLLHLALGTSTCDTDVPTVGAHLGVGMQVF